MRPDRRGFTLLELLVAIGLVVPVAVTASALALHSARAATGAGALAAAEAALDEAAAILEAELAPVDSAGLLGLSGASVTYHAVRGSGTWCRLDSLGFVVPAAGRWAASRVPVPGRDSLEVAVRDTSAGTRAAWRVGLAATPTVAACPASAPGLLLATSPAPPAGLVAGALLATTEVVELRAYQAGGATWLGMTLLGTGGAIEPVAGPFATGGIRFEGLGANGTATAVLGEVRAVQVQLVAGGLRPLTRDVVVALRR